MIGIGAKMKENIRQFLLTGTIEEAEKLRFNEEFRTMKLFNSVFGKKGLQAYVLIVVLKRKGRRRSCYSKDLVG
jgi:hypothetical protein